MIKNFTFKKLLIILSSFCFSFVDAQAWKALVDQNFGTPAGGALVSTTPASNILPGTTVYSPRTTTGQLNDGFYAVGVNPNNFDDFGAGFNNEWQHGGDHTTGTGYMMLINANPGKKGEVPGSYFLFGTSASDFPGASYRISFWGANLVKFNATSQNKNGYLGLAIRNNGNGTGINYSTGSWVFPRATGNQNNIPWNKYTTNFTLPLNYNGSILYFNFFNNDPDTTGATGGNDLALDDLLIEMQVVTLSGTVFIDTNSDGNYTGDFGVNGSSNPLYVYLTKANGMVVAKTQVAADGTYAFTTDQGVPYITSDVGLKLVLSSKNVPIASSVTSSTLMNYRNVSQNGGSSSVSSGANTSDGIFSLTNTSANLSNVNFGILGTAGVTLIKDVVPDAINPFGFTTTAGFVDLIDNTSNATAVNVSANDLSFTADGKLLVTNTAGEVYVLANGTANYAQPLAGSVLTDVDGGFDANTFAGVHFNSSTIKRTTNGGTSYTANSFGTPFPDVATIDGTHLFIAYSGGIYYFDGSNITIKGGPSRRIDYAGDVVAYIGTDGKAHLANIPQNTTPNNAIITDISTTTDFFDVAIASTGAQTDIYATTTTGAVLRYSGAGTTWTTMTAPPSNAVKITVDPSGTPWISMANGNLAAWTGTSWKTLYVRTKVQNTNFVNYFNLAPSSFNITEDQLTGYTLQSINHEGTGTSSANTAARTDNLTLAAGDRAFETFVNNKASLDTDGDGLTDDCDLDDDNDGILDTAEGSNCSVVAGKTVRIGYIPNVRDLDSDNGYTFDGQYMNNSGALKLTNLANFGPSGTVKALVTLVPMNGTITKASIMAQNLDIIFIGGVDSSFTSTDPSSYLSGSELAAILDWSDDRPQNVVISTQISTKNWNSTITSGNVNPDKPSPYGATTSIFNGPFGTITTFNQGGGFQAYFNNLSPLCSTKSVATDNNNRTVMYIDGVYNDILLADVDILTTYAGVTSGNAITSNNDKLFANIWAYAIQQTLCSDIDTDGDGIPNRLDLDSDGDGCADAVEGDENVVQAQLNTDGSINATANGGINADGVPNLVNSGGVADVGSDLGQGIGGAYDATVNSCYCFRFPVTNAGVTIPSKYGITSLGRAGAGNSNWPMVRQSAWMVLEAKTKGFVVNRLAFDASGNPVGIVAANFVEGMMVYDTTNNCLKIYNGSVWSCYSTPACP